MSTGSPLFFKNSLSDVVAGLSVAGVLLPEAVAYSAIAGVPAAHALMAALAGLCIYAVLGTSRLAVVAPTSAAAGVFASAVALGGAPMGFALVLATGLLLLVAGFFKAGFVGAFISRPVLRGFAWGLAVTIVIKQLPHMLGIHVHAMDALPLLWALGQQLGATHGVSLGCALAALALWLGLYHTQQWHHLPTSLVVLIASILAVSTLPLDWRGVAMVGDIHFALAWPALPALSRELWFRAFEIAPALLLILFAESWGSVRSLALQTGESVNADRELLALGGANLASGLLQGLPVGAGFSAASANQAAGARSRWAGVYAALALALMLAFAQQALQVLPVPALAAVVVGILSHKLWPDAVWKGFRFGRDAWVGVVAAIGVLVFGVLDGMLVAVGLSLVLAVRRFAQPLVCELRQLPGGRDFVDTLRHPDALAVPFTIVMRPEEPLFFANAESVFSAISARVQQVAGVQRLIVSMEACDDLDSTALEALIEFMGTMRQREVHVSLARIKDRPRAALARVALGAGGEQVPMFWSVADAVVAS